MDDLGRGLDWARKSGAELSLLGGGNPGKIPELERLFQEEFQNLASDPERIPGLLGDYSHPQGDQDFREIFAKSMSPYLGTEIGSDHICITGGSQTASFLLINLFSGTFSESKTGMKFRKILFPFVPEYVGYAEQGIHPDQILSLPPKVVHLSDREFRYIPDLEKIEETIRTGEIGAVYLSSPTNPTGNILTKEEIESISTLCERGNIPIILDFAYGDPFPGITQIRENFVHPAWKPGRIFTYSLSKLGLPGLRTGFLIAEPKIARRLGQMNAIVSLAPGNLGQELSKSWFQSGKIFSLAKETVKPFYLDKRNQGLEILSAELKNIDYMLHSPMGGFFFWIRFPNSKIDTRRLYEDLKAKSVFVVPGDVFFPGLASDFSHKFECIRLTYSRNLSELSRGVEILKEIFN